MADTKITALPANTTPLTTDILPVIDDPGGTPASQKMTIASLLTLAMSNVVVQVKTATGAGTYTPTALMKKCLVICTGGGGASGAVTNTDSVTGGGGGGGTAIRLYTAAEIGVSKAVSVGAGGADSTFGNGATLITGVKGGASVEGAGGTTFLAYGGVGGSASGGDINLVGQSGGIGVIVNTNLGAGGTGGSSFWGGGAASAAIDTPGVAGTNYGSGAAGAHTSTGTDRAGAAGAQGVIFILEFIG